VVGWHKEGGLSGLGFYYRTPPKFGGGLPNPSRRTNFFVYTKRPHFDENVVRSGIECIELIEFFFSSGT
jgi:hypothetical protein